LSNDVPSLSEKTHRRRPYARNLAQTDLLTKGCQEKEAIATLARRLTSMV
jgi:hypothetical protein